MRPPICRAKPQGQIQTEPIEPIKPQAPAPETKPISKSKTKGKATAPVTKEVAVEASNGQPDAVSQRNCTHPVVRIKIDRK